MHPLARSLPALAAFLLLGPACDDSSSNPPPPAPPGPGNLDGGPGGGGNGGGEAGAPTLPGPAPGPDTLGLPLPGDYAFVTIRESMPTAISGSSFFLVGTSATGPLSDLERALIRVEWNATLAGRKADAIPVRLRMVTNGQPSTGFTCVEQQSGSSGRTYRTLTQKGADPMTGEPHAYHGETCNWYLVKTGKDRAFKVMVFWEGQEAYLGTTESDPASGRRVHAGEGFSRAATFRLVTADQNGQPLPP